MTVSLRYGILPCSVMGIKISNKKKVSVIFLYSCHTPQKTIKNPIISISIPINREQIKMMTFDYFDYLNFMAPTFKDVFTSCRTTTPNMSAIPWALLISLHLKNTGLFKPGIDSSALCLKFETKASERNEISNPLEATIRSRKKFIQSSNI